MNTKKPGSELFFDVFESPVGKLFLLFSGKNLAGASFEKPDCRRGEAPEAFNKELNNYFEGKSKNFKQGTVFLEGTDFEKTAWRALKEIPNG